MTPEVWLIAAVPLGTLTEPLELLDLSGAHGVHENHLTIVDCHRTIQGDAGMFVVHARIGAV